MIDEVMFVTFNLDETKFNIAYYGTFSSLANCDS